MSSNAVTPVKTGVQHQRLFWIPAFAGMTVLLFCSLALAKPKIAKLAKKLLYGDESTRTEAVKAFNKLPMDAQYELVPDFMVALTDDDPQVRKVAARILKAMGVSTASTVPDAKTEVLVPAPATPAEMKQELADEKKSEPSDLPDVRLETPPSAPVKTASADPWADLKSMRNDGGQYDDLRKEMEREKKGQVSLDVAALRSDAPANDTPLATVVESLKDPNPWVRSQAARRLGMIHPAPTETIPTLIDLMQDPNVEVRRAAAAALGSFGSLAREATPALTKALSDPDDAVSQISAEALKQIQSR